MDREDERLYNAALDESLATREMRLAQKKLMDAVYNELERSSTAVITELSAVRESMLQIFPFLMEHPGSLRSGPLGKPSLPVPLWWEIEEAESLPAFPKFFLTRRRLLVAQHHVASLLNLTTRVMDGLATVELEPETDVQSQHSVAVREEQQAAKNELEEAVKALNTILRNKKKG